MKLHQLRTTYLTYVAVQMAACLALTLAPIARGRFALQCAMHAAPRKTEEM